MNIFGHYNTKYALTHPWVILKVWYYEVKYFIQRGMRGYSDRDTWDLFSYLTEVIILALKDLQLNKHGYPVGLKCRCEWDRILYQIIEGFEYNKKLCNLDIEYKSKEFKIAQRKSKKGLQLFAEHFNSLWD